MRAFISSHIPRPIRRGIRGALMVARANLDPGRLVMCNVCGGGFSRFVIFNGRPNALCPRCKSLERHRLVFAYLVGEAKVFSEPTRLLHFAPEKALHMHFAASPNIDYVTADLGQSQFLGEIEARPDLQMDVMDIRFPDASFDVVICNHVLEHVPDDRRAMREIFRVLRPGGFAILQVPINPDSEEILEDPTLTAAEMDALYGPTHLRYYGHTGYVARLREIGFQVFVSPLARFLQFHRLVLDKNEKLYVCTKP